MQISYICDVVGSGYDAGAQAVQTDGILAGYGSVPLAFTHTMAKINVNLTYRN